MRRIVLSLATTTALTLGALPAGAAVLAPGDLDPAFSGGVATTKVGNRTTWRAVTLPAFISSLAIRGVILSPSLQITSPVAASTMPQVGRVPRTRAGKNLVTQPLACTWWTITVS